MTRAEGDTIISGSISEQDHLHSVLAEVRRLGLPIQSVQRPEPDLEEVFLRLVEQEGVGD